METLGDEQVETVLQKMVKDKAELDAMLPTVFGLQHFNPVKVDHCPQAYGISLTFNDGFKLTYSGDTRPCEK